MTDRHGVMPGTTRQPEWRLTGGGDTGIDGLHQSLVTGHGIGRMRLLAVEGEAPSRRDSMCLVQEFIQRTIPLRIVQRADIQTQCRPPGDNIHRPGTQLATPHGRDQRVVRHVSALARLDITRQRFHRQCPLRRRTQRILTQCHRRGAGMSRLADEVDREASRTGDTGHGTQRQILGFQHRALLDVYFQIAQRRIRLQASPGGRLPGKPKAFERVAKRDAVLILYPLPVRLPASGDGMAAEQGRTEAGALFITETDHFQREGQALLAGIGALPEMCQGGHPEQDTKNAVITAGVRHAVQM